jgi:hypothetical protein
MLVRPDSARCLERPVLVVSIGIGVDEGDGERLRAARDEQLRRGCHLVGIDRSSDAAVGERALVDFDAHVAVGDRDEIAPQAPGPPAVAPAHLEHVTEAAGRDDADLRPAPFQERIGADRGAVHDRADGAHAAERAQAVEEALRLVAATRGHFGGAECSCRRVEQKQVGESPAYIDADDRTRPAHAEVRPRAVAVASTSTDKSSRSTTL